ncbi:MAG TPA: YncE family protein, partial [Mycobacterium sp.]|nr:YncE family protein [Mycobacterium sp.]
MRDVKSFPVVAEIAVNSGPVGGIAATADGRRVLMTNYRGDSVSVIDTRSGAVAQTITGIEEPLAIAVAGAGNDRAYVNTASAAYDAIVAIDMRANTVVATHPLAFSVTDLAVSTDGKHAYASRSEEGRADIAVLN